EEQVEQELGAEDAPDEHRGGTRRPGQRRAEEGEARPGRREDAGPRPGGTGGDVPEQRDGRAHGREHRGPGHGYGERVPGVRHGGKHHLSPSGRGPPGWGAEGG